MPRIRSKQIIGEKPINDDDITNKEYVDGLVLSDADKRKLAYFHALGKVMTNIGDDSHTSEYKSSHNIHINEIWTSELPFASTYTSAFVGSTVNVSVTLFDKVDLVEVPNSNGQSYYYKKEGVVIKQWISPVDVTLDGEPSYGYTVKLYDGSGNEQTPNDNIWYVDYYSGIIHFVSDYTPVNLNLGTIQARFFQYTGEFGSNASSSLLSVDNNNMECLTTSHTQRMACISPIGDNIKNSCIYVYVNGIQLNTGSSGSDDSYFSNDGGISKRNSGEEEIGDLLYWNYVNDKANIGYDLNKDVDKISFIYLKN